MRTRYRAHEGLCGNLTDRAASDFGRHTIPWHSIILTTRENMREIHTRTRVAAGSASHSLSHGDIEGEGHGQHEGHRVALEREVRTGGSRTDKRRRPS